jgi:hypothetical protein
MDNCVYISAIISKTFFLLDYMRCDVTWGRQSSCEGRHTGRQGRQNGGTGVTVMSLSLTPG